MTEKRFVIFQDSYDDLYIQDKEVYRATGIIVGNEEDVKYENVSKIVELLNELAEENVQLRKQRDELVQSIRDTAKISADAITKVWTGDDLND